MHVLIWEPENQGKTKVKRLSSHTPTVRSLVASDEGSAPRASLIPRSRGNQAIEPISLSRRHGVKEEITLCSPISELLSGVEISGDYVNHHTESFSKDSVLGMSLTSSTAWTTPAGMELGVEGQ